jgi:ubiquinone/menaquinone biosynthesis C-methylase UbiE
MSIGETIFASLYGRLSAKSERAGLGERRRGLIANATGRVLEIGGGLGANLPYYGPGVESVTLTEPGPAMAKRLEQHLAEQRGGLAFEVELARAPAEQLPFGPDSFDTVVSTLVLCSVEDQAQALSELRRVLKPGGQLLFLEHVRGEGRIATVQDRINWLNKLVVRCDCNRTTLQGIADSGFTVSSVEHGELPEVPPFARPMIVGTAS